MTKQLDGNCNVTSESQLLYNLFKKPIWNFFGNRNEKFNVGKEYCVALHDDKMCFLPSCRCLFILTGNIEKLLQKLDAFCVNCQHVDYLYTHFKYRFSDKIFVKSGQFCDYLQRTVHFNQQSSGGVKITSISKKRLLRRKNKKLSLSSYQKTKSTQTCG